MNLLKRSRRSIVLLSNTLGLALCLFIPIAATAHDDLLSAIPSEINAPDDQKMLMSVDALGQQIYKCQDTAQSGSPVLSWVLQEPTALLLDESDRSIGFHSKGPTWSLNDGSSAVGEVKAKVEVDHDSIPWLLLKIKSHQGQGKMSSVNWVQRIQTEGGKAPASCTPEYLNTQLRVPYKAVYVLYGTPN